MLTIDQPKGKKYEERALLGTAKACYFSAVLAFATFVYSYFVLESHALDLYSRSLEEDHFAFVAGGRWYFLAGAIAFVVMGLRSIRKANRLHSSNP